MLIISLIFLFFCIFSHHFLPEASNKWLSPSCVLQYIIGQRGGKSVEGVEYTIQYVKCVVCIGYSQYEVHIVQGLV